MSSATSPNQEGVAGTDSEDIWMLTEESAILFISTSLLGTVLFFLIKEAYFYAGPLLVTSRCAIRGTFMKPFVSEKCSACAGDAYPSTLTMQGIRPHFYTVRKAFCS